MPRRGTAHGGLDPAPSINTKMLCRHAHRPIQLEAVPQWRCINMAAKISHVTKARPKPRAVLLPLLPLQSAGVACVDHHPRSVAPIQPDSFQPNQIHFSHSKKKTKAAPKLRLYLVRSREQRSDGNKNEPLRGRTLSHPYRDLVRARHPPLRSPECFCHSYSSAAP